MYSVDIDLDKNDFSGTIPPEFARLKNLQYLSLDNNRLRGTIPPAIGQMKKLSVLLLQNNRLTGSLDDLFGIEENILLSSLFNIDLSGNLITGRIPGPLFHLQYLNILSLGVNCFEGPLPDMLCDASHLEVLSLDGLRSANDCNKYGLDISFIRLLLWNDFSGTIPSCIWQLPNITVLHLSGNGLKGELHDIPSTSNLNLVSLTHNRLGGTIPLSMQTHKFDSFDVTNNKLFGEISNELSSAYSKNTNGSAASGTLKLSINRLSGHLPQSLIQAPNVDVLQGNIFGCANIPNHDPNSPFYVCGSRLLDLSLVILLVLALLLICLGVCSLLIHGYYSNPNISSKQNHEDQKNNESLLQSKNIQSFLLMANDAINKLRYYAFYLDYISPTSLPQLHLFDQLLWLMTFGVAVLAIFGFLLVFPVYLLKIYDKFSQEGKYSTRLYMYRWSWSLVFVTGNIPAAIILAAWTTLLLLTMWLFHQDMITYREASSKVNSVVVPSEHSGFLSRSISFLSTALQQLHLSKEESSTTQGSNLDSNGKESTSQNAHEEELRFSSIATKGENDDKKWLTCENLTENVAIVVKFVFNILFVFSVHAVYVYSSYRDISNNVLLILQFMIAAFMIIWNLVVIPSRMLKRVSSSVQRVWIKVCLLLINTIIIPSFATAFTSTSCFQVFLVLFIRISYFLPCSLYRVYLLSQTPYLRHILTSNVLNIPSIVQNVFIWMLSQ